MTFEEILPGLKVKKSTFAQAGVERRTTSLTPLRSTGKAGGDAPISLINVTARAKGFPCGARLPQ